MSQCKLYPNVTATNLVIQKRASVYVATAAQATDRHAITYTDNRLARVRIQEHCLHFRLVEIYSLPLQ